MRDTERRAQIDALRALVAAIPANATFSGDVGDEGPPVMPACDSTVSSEVEELGLAADEGSLSALVSPRGSMRGRKKARSCGLDKDSLFVAGLEDDSGTITDLDRAREIALNRLTYRSRSRAELLNDLVQRCVSHETATEVVERFTRVGLLDDAEFAAEWVRSRQGPKSLSSSRLRAELRAKGIPDDIIETTLGSSASDDEDMAIKLAIRKAQGMAGVETAVAERRLAGYLARKGYAPSVVWKAVRAALSDEAEIHLDGSIDRR